MHIKFHCQSRYYQATVLVIAEAFIVAMMMVVMGDTYVQSITAIHRLLCW